LIGSHSAALQPIDAVRQLSPDALAQALKPLAEAHRRLLGGNGVAICHGLYGFNPVLCAFALCCCPYRHARPDRPPSCS
jgi:urea transporter